MRAVYVAVMVAGFVFGGCDRSESRPDVPPTDSGTSGSDGLALMGDLVAGRRGLELATDSLARELEAHPEELDGYVYEMVHRTAFIPDGMFYDFHEANDALPLTAVLREYLLAHPGFISAGVTVFGASGDPLSSLSTRRELVVGPLPIGRLEYSIQLFADSAWVHENAPDYDLLARPWFKEAIRRKAPVWTGPSLEPPYLWLMIRSVPLIRDGLVYAIVRTAVVVPPPDGVTEQIEGTNPNFALPESSLRTAPPEDRAGQAWRDHLAGWARYSRIQEEERRARVQRGLDGFAARIRSKRDQFGAYTRETFKEEISEEDPLLQEVRRFVETQPDLYGASVSLFDSDGSPLVSVWSGGSPSWLGRREPREPMWFTDDVIELTPAGLKAKPWIKAPLASMRPAWTDPYLEKRPGGAADLWLVAHSVPLIDQGKVYAIVTAELAVFPPGGLKASQ